MSQRCGVTRFSILGALAASRTASHRLCRNRPVARHHPACRGRDTSGAASSGSLPQRGEQRRTERHLAITAAFALVDAQQHALTVDVPDFQVGHLAAAQARAIQRQQQRAVIEVLRTADQALPLPPG